MRGFKLRRLLRREGREKPRVPLKFHETSATYKRERTDKPKEEGRRTPQIDKEPTRFQLFRAILKDSVKGIFRFAGYNLVGILPADVQRFIARKIFKDEKKANDFSNVSLATEGFLALSCVFAPMCSAAELIPRIPFESGNTMGKLSIFLLADSILRLNYRDFMKWEKREITAAGSVFTGLIYNSIKALARIKRAIFDQYFIGKREELRNKNAQASD
jgi:hypothetical protein